MNYIGTVFFYFDNIFFYDFNLISLYSCLFVVLFAATPSAGDAWVNTVSTKSSILTTSGCRFFYFMRNELGFSLSLLGWLSVIRYAASMAGISTVYHIDWNNTFSISESDYINCLFETISSENTCSVSGIALFRNFLRRMPFRLLLWRSIIAAFLLGYKKNMDAFISRKLFHRHSKINVKQTIFIINSISVFVLHYIV